MNILQIVPELNVGGVETGTIDLAKYLVRQGHKVVVISAGGELVAGLEASGAKHYSLPVHRKSLISILKTIGKVARVIRDENIRIVHCRSRVPAWIGYFAARITDTIFITTCHGFYSTHFFSSVMGWGKLIIAPSQAIARHMIEDFGVLRQRVRIVPRSVDLERFRFIPPRDRDWSCFNIGIIGRLSPIKGHIDFLKAVSKVLRQHPAIKVWVVGDAAPGKQPYKEEIGVMVRRLGLSHCTEFLGNQKDIPGVLSQLNMLVMATTTQEAFGRVIIEAHASGVPVVATRVGGVVDIVDDGKTGLLVSPNDPEDMHRAMMKIIKDEKLRSSLVYSAYEKVKRDFNVELMVSNTLKVYEEAGSKFNVLIIKLGAVGDIILSVPALRAVRKNFKKDNYKIACVVGKEARELLDRCPYIDELILYDYKGKDKGVRGLLKTGKLLRKKYTDFVIDLQNNRTSHILSRLSMSLKRYGYDNGKFSFLLNRKVRWPEKRLSPVEHQFRILRMLGIELEDDRLELWPKDEDRRRVEDFLGSQFLARPKYLAGMNIGASGRWQSKQWPKEYVVKLIDGLSNIGVRCILTGQERHLPEAKELYAMARAQSKPIIACGKTNLNELACLIEKCDVFITQDSAPMHMAAALGVPFVAMFGPTDPVKHLPPAEKCVLLKKDLACSPCYKPKCKDALCMSGITVNEALEAVEKLLRIESSHD
ncbi:MAG: glycosyltransferase family 9 protein [Candidatus Omnitrophica bacterium]|nr:glycosyltransferase family 9 protein [Candidatus Omnitrophota bacterium]